MIFQLSFTKSFRCCPSFKRHQLWGITCIGMSSSAPCLNGALPCSEVDEYEDASNDPEPIMVGNEDVSGNPACQAILANEVGLAPADFQDDKLRKGQVSLFPGAARIICHHCCLCIQAHCCSGLSVPFKTAYLLHSCASLCFACTEVSSKAR